MWQDLLHRREPFWNLTRVQTLSYLSRFHRLHVHPGRTTNLFFPSNFRLPTQQLSSIENDQLQHGLSHASWIQVTSYTHCILAKKHVSLGHIEGPSTNNHDQNPGFLNFCTMRFVHTVNFCFGYVNSLNPDSSLSSCTRAHPTVASECCTVDMFINGA